MTHSNLDIGPGRTTADRQPLALWLVVTATIATGIAYLTLSPSIGLAGTPWYTDELAHITAFLLLVLPTAALWPRVSARVGILAVLYGGAIELIQPYFGRFAAFTDLLADGVGVGLGIILGASLRWMMVPRPAGRTARRATAAGPARGGRAR